jgi:hypothetical protein
MWPSSQITHQGKPCLAWYKPHPAAADLTSLLLWYPAALGSADHEPCQETWLCKFGSRSCWFCASVVVMEGTECAAVVVYGRPSVCCCSKIAEAEAAVSVNEKKWLVMHVQLQLDELQSVCCCHGYGRHCACSCTASWAPCDGNVGW